MSERAISDPSQHGWVEVDGRWVWDASGGGGSIQDGDTEGQITTWDGTEWTPEGAVVVADGNVGIGTDSVTNPYGGTEYTDVNIDGVWGGALSFKLGGEEQGWIGQRNSGGGAMMIGASAGKGLYFSTDGNNERLRIDADGNVHITGKLFINGEEVGAGGGSGGDSLWTDNGDGSISYSGTAFATDFIAE